ncbi:transposase, IS605 OrfB family protein [Natrinema altunense JCM 12890]|uniref:Transposase, IS605 OrfB family protein n=2 Tax=Natrinema altunense TaxID=222984 RepID=L9ZEK2_NATA2|nr:transposase, IS605 OrfB family protein [Natrinema altunense JCM 12890]
MHNRLPELKDEWQELKQVHSKVLQRVVTQLYDNLKSLSEQKKNGYKVGKLRYKGKGWFKTIEYNQSGFQVKETDTRLDLLQLSKIGKIPIRLHREIRGEVKGIIVKKDSAGDWFAIFQTEHDEPNISVTDSDSEKSVVGIDLGITHFAVDSDGNRIEHPKNVEKAEERLQKEQRNLSRKEKGSNNYEKQRKELARVHKRVKNRRTDFLHKLSTAYVNKYDIIAVEDLNVSDMVQGQKNSKNTMDSAWRTFIQMLLYKAESAGTEVILVDPKDTTKECSKCAVKTDKKLWQRKHSCPSCGYETDRDFNAARNILRKGIEESEIVGKGQAEVTPADTGTAADTKNSESFCDVSASTVVETGSPLPPRSIAERWWRVVHSELDPGDAVTDSPPTYLRHYLDADRQEELIEEVLDDYSIPEDLYFDAKKAVFLSKGPSASLETVDRAREEADLEPVSEMLDEGGA